MEALEHKANVLVADVCQLVVGQVFQVLSLQLIGARGRNIQTANQIHQGSLAGTRGTHDG